MTRTITWPCLILYALLKLKIKFKLVKATNTIQLVAHYRHYLAYILRHDEKDAFLLGHLIEIIKKTHSWPQTNLLQLNLS